MCMKRTPLYLEKRTLEEKTHLELTRLARREGRSRADLICEVLSGHVRNDASTMAFAEHHKIPNVLSLGTDFVKAPSLGVLERVP